MIVFGGNCEPLSAMRYLNIPMFAGPFDWFGIPSEVFPKILISDWWKDVFSLDNITTSTSLNDGYIYVRDLKYNIATPHHFKRDGMRNYKQTLKEQLPKFRDNLKKRWFSMLETLKTGDTILYREYNPLWFDIPTVNPLKLVCETILDFAPKSNLVMISEEPQSFENAATAVQNKLHQEYFRLDRSIWVPIWRFVATNNLENGKIYDLSMKK